MKTSVCWKILLLVHAGIQGIEIIYTTKGIIWFCHQSLCKLNSQALGLTLQYRIIPSLCVCMRGGGYVDDIDPKLYFFFNLISFLNK